MIALRPHQRQGITDIRHAMRAGHRRIIYELFCGGGKTWMMAAMAAKAGERGKRVYFLVHRDYLLRQLSATLTQAGLQHGLIAAGRPMDEHPVQVASVLTLANRLDRLPAPDLIICDEAHHYTARTFHKPIEAWPNAYVIGLTATPERTDGKPLADLFQTMVRGPSADALTAAGFLAEYDLLTPPAREIPDLTGVRRDRGDYVRADLDEAMDKPVIHGNAVNHYLKHCPGKRAIAYCVSRKASEALAAVFNAAGVPAVHIDARTPEAERQRVTAAFSNDEIRVICNVDLISEGFDIPGRPVEAVIGLRPTQSLRVFVQQYSRCLRPQADGGKAVILDCVGNALYRHGWPTDPIEWSLAGHPKRAGAAASRGIKQCEQCYFVHRPAPSCPRCGFVYPVASRAEIEQIDGELQKLEREQLAKRRRMDVGRAETLEDLKRIAKARGYNPKWAHIRWKIKQQKARA